MNKFTLEIELGNDAMRTPEDVANVPEQLANNIRDREDCGSIRDTNGNTVGFWSVEYPEDEE